MSYIAVLIFPNQLFENIESILPKDDRTLYHYYLVEDSLYFSDPERIKTFNGLKLLLHRASMKFYADYLTKKGLKVEYIDFAEMDKFHKAIAGSKSVIHYDVVDHLLEKRLNDLMNKYNKKREVLDNPGFICTNNDLKDFLETREGKKRKFFQTDFYRWQRNRLDILMDDSGDYIGGKLSFDNENRESVPKTGFKTIKYHLTQSNKYIEEARQYVSEKFPDHYGNINNYEHIAFDFSSARAKLNDFLKNRLINFGTYEDAIDIKNPFLYHSILSSSINIGIITPMEVVQSALDYYYTYSDKIGINQIEGFIRQIIGWREYYRMVYLYLYDDLVKQNLLGHTRELNDLWYTGETGIEPVDHCIQSAFDFGYLHHIERLMIVGQFMLLCEIHPNDMYRWFMEFAIDSYDWVMVPNVYGMVGYNDGGATTTKIYISSSNYVLKMSNFKKGTYKEETSNWDYIWRAMYYRFIKENYSVLNKNVRTRRMVWQMNRLKGDVLDKLLKDADDYLDRITNPEQTK